MTSIPSNLGFPRIGRERELKMALERYWAGEISESALREVGRTVRRQGWALQVELGIEHVPSNDFCTTTCSTWSLSSARSPSVSVAARARPAI